MKIQVRLVVLAAVVAMVAALVPGGPAAGSHDAITDGDFADGSNGVLQLHMAPDGDYFTWTDDASDIHTRTISENRCEVSLSGDGLVTFAGTTHRGPGYKDYGIGVKSGGSQGVACTRVSDGEVLHLTLTGVLDGLEVAEAQLDIEVKQGAAIELTTYFGEYEVETFTLRSGGAIVPGEGTDPPEGEDYLATSTALDPIANCANRSDSGPDSGANDNCRWVIQNMTPFTGMTMRALSGEFTLEGGNDGTPAAAEGFGGDSLFFLTDIDGILNCGDTVTVGDALTDPEGVFTRLNFFNEPECVLKPYEIAAQFQTGDGSNLVDFLPEGSVVAHYSARLTGVAVSSPGENPLTRGIEYDRDGEGAAFGFEYMAWCTAATIVYNTDAGGDFVVDATTGLVERTITAATLPPDLATEDEDDYHTWCIADMETRVVGTSGEIQTTWWVYGEDDPKFDFS